MRALLPLSLILAGCATTHPPTADELRVNQAVKTRYWQIQDAQQAPPVRNIPLHVPEHVEDGALRVPSTLYLPYP